MLKPLDCWILQVHFCTILRFQTDSDCSFERIYTVRCLCMCTWNDTESRGAGSGADLSDLGVVWSATHTRTALQLLQSFLLQVCSFCNRFINCRKRHIHKNIKIPGHPRRRLSFTCSFVIMQVSIGLRSLLFHCLELKQPPAKEKTITHSLFLVFVM